MVEHIYRDWRLKVFGIVWISLCFAALCVAVAYYCYWNRKNQNWNRKNQKVSLGVAMISMQILKNFQDIEKKSEADFTDLTQTKTEKDEVKIDLWADSPVGPLGHATSTRETITIEDTQNPRLFPLKPPFTWS